MQIRIMSKRFCQYSLICVELDCRDERVVEGVVKRVIRRATIRSRVRSRVSRRVDYKAVRSVYRILSNKVTRKILRVVARRVCRKVVSISLVCRRMRNYYSSKSYKISNRHTRLNTYKQRMSIRQHCIN